jgi:hypothetical protein
MISLTFGLASFAAANNDSHSSLIYSPFFLYPGEGIIPVPWIGGHSHGAVEGELPNYLKVFQFMCLIQEDTFEKSFKVKYPLSELNVINIEIREVKAKTDEE